MSVLELVAVVLTLAAVYLTTRQVIWCWPLSMVSVVLYAIVFYQARLYAEVGLQSLYLVLSAYGWWAWRVGREPDSALRVTRLSRGRGLGVAAAGIVGGAALGLLLARFTNAALPLLDSVLAAFSVAAQWLQARKVLEAWLLWLAVDVVYVGMFAYKQLYLTAALYAVFLYLAGMGYVAWRDSMRSAAAVGRA